jgi:hypothetical protein
MRKLLGKALAVIEAWENESEEPSGQTAEVK